MSYPRSTQPVSEKRRTELAAQLAELTRANLAKRLPVSSYAPEQSSRELWNGVIDELNSQAKAVNPSFKIPGERR